MRLRQSWLLGEICISRIGCLAPSRVDGRSCDSAGGEVWYWQLPVLRYPFHKLQWRLQLLSLVHEFLLAQRRE